MDAIIQNGQAISFGIKLFLVIFACFSVQVTLIKKTSSWLKIASICFFLWAGALSSYVAKNYDFLFETYIIRGTYQQNEMARYNQIWFSGFNENTKIVPVEGKWDEINHNGLEIYGLFPDSDERRSEETTDYLTLEIPVGENRTLVFIGNIYGGIVEILSEDLLITVDTYRETEEIMSNIAVELTDSPSFALGENAMKQLLPFVSLFLPLALAWVGTLFLVLKNKKIQRILRFQFLFEELVKRDFTVKYKRTVLGVFWSVLSPLLTLVVMYFVLGNFFGAGIDHYIVYLFCGQLVFNYFSEATNLGMGALMENAGIFTKVNIPKYLFVLSKNIASMISFFLTFLVLLMFVLSDGLMITPKFICLLYPMICLMLFNIGMGLVLSAVYMFFRDTHYLWNIFTLLLMYMSAVFYNVSGFEETQQQLFYYNPIYTLILYFREIIINGVVPGLWLHYLIAFYTVTSLSLGGFMYKKYNHEFLYYV